MPSVIACVPAKQVTVEARIVRADGTVEELGVVAYWHRNPFKRLLHSIKHRIFKSRS